MTAVLLAIAALLATLSVERRETPIDAYVGMPQDATRRRLLLPSPGSAVAGASAGIVGAIALDPASLLPLGVIGALGGLLVNRSLRSTSDQRRARRLVQELPTVADTLALHVLAGESVATAIRRFMQSSTGVAADELTIAIESDRSLDEALRSATQTTAHPEAARLYDLLGHAHRTGGGLADALTALAADYRATMTREITAEGGRRALVTYGPILALMVPVTLLFLMYPTLAGLNALSSTP